MIDISTKKKTYRTAKAQAIVKLNTTIMAKIKAKTIPKGDVLETARLAAILAAKNTSQLMPFCHIIEISSVNIDFSLLKEDIIITSIIKAHAKTGVEMEALASVTIAALNIYDMCKMFTKDIQITKIELLEKTGGKSGDYKKYASKNNLD